MSQGAHPRLVAGRSVTERLELDAEIYDDRRMTRRPLHDADLAPLQTAPRIIALFMAGRQHQWIRDGSRSSWIRRDSDFIEQLWTHLH